MLTLSKQNEKMWMNEFRKSSEMELKMVNMLYKNFSNHWNNTENVEREIKVALSSEKQKINFCNLLNAGKCDSW